MKFTYNPRIIKHLGYELITSDETAITELIKNSYDAKSKVVKIQFLSSVSALNKEHVLAPIQSTVIDLIESLKPCGVILLEDSGKGMNYDTLMKGFFEIGGTLKKDEKDGLKETDDIILGEKGIGRLAAQRISPILILETAIKDSNQVNVVEVKWDEFTLNNQAEAPEYIIEREGVDSYTRLWLVGTEERPLNFQNFFEEREEFDYDLFGNPGKSLGRVLVVKNQLHSALSFLYSPFEDKKSVIDLEMFFDGQVIKHDFDYETINIAESVHSLETEIIKNNEGIPVDLEFHLKMTVKPWFVERIHYGELGKVLYQDWKLLPSKYNELLKKYNDHYEKSLTESFCLSDVVKKWDKKYQFSYDFISAVLKFAPIKGKIYSFKRDKSLMSMAIKSAVENGYINSDAVGIKSDFSEFLSTHNGIKLYRNSFRIGTIGNKDNDWLKLQQKRTTGQQFYRFELGNVIGFFRVNDKKQNYIYETSSREQLTDNIYVNALQILLGEIIEIFSPSFTKKAVEITKYILDLERLVPENTNSQIESELEKSRRVLDAAKQNAKAIRAALNSIKDSIDLDSDAKKEAVKKVFRELEPVAANFEQNIEDTNRSFTSANNLLEVAKQQQIRIKTEAYNNYKLMANGLVTEVITHELHSLLSKSGGEAQKYEEHFKTIENYFLENQLYEINSAHLIPVKDKFTHLFSRMSDLDRFYSFLEKTFLYKGNSEDLIPIKVQDELHEITQRFKFRLTRHKIDIDFSSVNNTWEVPKGSLLHVFYNLIDNSIYWIKERQKLAKVNAIYRSDKKDQIIIRTINPTTIHFYDSGTGVIERYQNTLFNEMESGKENGRGMGLYIVRQFLKSFGGEIELMQPLNEYKNRYMFEIRMKNSPEGGTND